MDSPTVLCIDDRAQVSKLMDRVLAVGLEKPATKRIWLRSLLARMISNNQVA
jgi:hypothetical protein